MSSMRPEARIGTLLDGKYEIERLLGRGSSGVVYAATHRYMQRQVAVKVLHPHLLESRDHVARFLREARVASSIQHPNVAAVLDAGRVEPDGPYLVTELLEGEELYARMKRGRFTLEQIVAVVHPLLLGLHAAHEKGIVHRDVKPENVFLAVGPYGASVKLIDFGLAKRPLSPHSSELTAADRTVGTPLYMSPEQIRNANLDGRTDVWAVGIILHELLTGRPPFDERQSAMMLLTRIAKERVASIDVRRPGLPPWLVQVVDRALEPDRNDRWGSAAAMAEALLRGSASGF